MHHFCDPDAQLGFCFPGSMQACQAKEYIILAPADHERDVGPVGNGG